MRGVKRRKKQQQTTPEREFFYGENMTLNKKIIIAGPCAAESREQIKETLKEAKLRRVDFVRLSLWKPRTKPGFEGLGEAGIPLLVETAREGINPGTEVLLPEQAKRVMYAVFSAVENTRLLLWIGSRNQNHYIQREIARIASMDKRVVLMVKNQPWNSREHWEGIIGHVLAGGIDRENLILCHRGFTPNGHNPHNFRNVPDFPMAMEVREKTGLPMIFDPSHTGGSVSNVVKITKEAVKFDFDGVIVEVHHNPKIALTDAKQQLTWEKFDQLQKIFS